MSGRDGRGRLPSPRGHKQTLKSPAPPRPAWPAVAARSPGPASARRRVARVRERAPSRALPARTLSRRLSVPLAWCSPAQHPLPESGTAFLHLNRAGQDLNPSGFGCAVIGLPRAQLHGRTPVLGLGALLCCRGQKRCPRLQGPEDSGGQAKTALWALGALGVGQRWGSWKAQRVLGPVLSGALGWWGPWWGDGAGACSARAGRAWGAVLKGVGAS